MRAMLLGVAVVGALPSASHAQPANPGVTFDRYFQEYAARMQQHYALADQGIAITLREYGVRAIERSSDQVEANVERVRAAPELGPIDSNTAPTVADRLSAAISTDLEDVEAGFSIAPAKLFGDETSPWAGTTLTVASLERGGVRGGAGWSFSLSVRPLAYEELELETCRASPAVEAAQELRGAYVALCNRIPLDAYPSGTSESDLAAQRQWLGVALACGHPTPAEVPAARIKELQMGDQLYVRSRDLVKASENITALDPYREVLDAWLAEKPTWTSCLGEMKLNEAVAAALWKRKRHKVGIAAHADLFALRYGFQPDPDAELSHGELQKVAATVEYQLGWRRMTVSIGAGAGYAREAPSDDLGLTVSSSLGLRVLVARLDGKRLVLANLDEYAPVFALGLTGAIERAGDPPDTQETPWNKVEITAFADFTVSKELAFRLGVPLRAEIVTREADPDAMPPVAEKRGLQWSLPVFVATVLKL